jgi:hypothetical protein
MFEMKLTLRFWQLHFSSLPSTVHASNMAQNPTNQTKQDASRMYSSLPLSPLDQCIRILDLDASSNPKASLSGRLRVASLKSRPRFAARSYVWDINSTRRKRDKILCRRVDPGISYNIDITTNCEAALRQLRNLFGPLSIWVDAICINQDDVGEKTSQIPLMEEIYTWAQPVYVWLGPGTNASNRTMDWFSAAAKFSGPFRQIEYFRAVNSSEKWSSKAQFFLGEFKMTLMRPCMSHSLSMFLLCQLQLSDCELSQQ